MTKTIYIKDLSNDKEYELKVEESLKISELKKQIEALINRKIDNKLTIKKNKRPNPTSLSDETITVKEAHIKNGDTIIVGKAPAKGGLFKIILIL
jgi:hypothetical protein